MLFLLHAPCAASSSRPFIRASAAFAQGAAASLEARRFHPLSGHRRIGRRSARGRDGGYRLTRPAAEISAGEVLRAAEGGKMRVVDCPALADGCAREDICTTADFWKGLDAVIGSYVDGVSLAELVGGESCGGMFGMGISCPDADE